MRFSVPLAIVGTLFSVVAQEPEARGGYVVLAGFDSDDPFDAAVRRLAAHRNARVVRIDAGDPRVGACPPDGARAPPRRDRAAA